jgi:hypothetical protein
MTPGMRRLRVANAIRRAASRQPCAPRSRERARRQDPISA